MQFSIGPGPSTSTITEESSFAVKPSACVERSSSETHLAAMELESPESGFADDAKRAAKSVFGRSREQVERESLHDSTSSLEITVN